MSKKTTVDDLARITQNGFVDLEDRLGDKIDSMGSKVGNLEKKIDHGFQSILARLDLIRLDISDLPAIKHELKDLRSRVEHLENKPTSKAR